MPIYAIPMAPRTVRGRVALVLNGTLFFLFLLFLAYDYRNDSADRLEIKRTALEEQARILVPGVRSRQGPEDLRDYLAATRQQMEDTHSDVHIVAATVNGRFLQSGVRPEDENDLARLLVETVGSNSFIMEWRGNAFLVGHHHQEGTTVCVAEDLQDVRAAIRADLERHVVAVTIALLCGVVIINGVLWLAFQRPLSILTGAVADVGSGKLGLRIQRIGTVEFDVLATAINGMSQALAEAESARTAQLRKARAIQDSLLPARMRLAGATIAHHYQPAEMVGGDYCDLLVLPDGSGLFCIADATGHGVSAALVAAMVKICLLNAVEHSSDPGDILGFINRRLSAMDLPEMFVTMLLVRLYLNPPGLEYAGAGHDPAFLVTGDKLCQQLESEGPVLGIGVDFAWTSQRERFEPGDRLLLYTDGVTEASGDKNGQFGLARLQETLLGTSDLAPADAIQRIVERVAGHCAGKPFHDDLTVVLATLDVGPE